jgi:hypothetical protein
MVTVVGLNAAVCRGVSVTVTELKHSEELYAIAEISE